MELIGVSWMVLGGEEVPAVEEVEGEAVVVEDLEIEEEFNTNLISLLLIAQQAIDGIIAPLSTTIIERQQDKLQQTIVIHFVTPIARWVA